MKRCICFFLLSLMTYLGASAYTETVPQVYYTESVCPRPATMAFTLPEKPMESRMVEDDILEDIATDVDVCDESAEADDIPVVYVSAEEAVSTIPYTDEEIDLIALVTMAEAEGEIECGKRLVIDTILNRVDSAHFPNTVSGVVWQANQFTSMWNGRVGRCYVMEDIRALVIEEIEGRIDDSVVFFQTTSYSKYGVPVCQVGNHYFSKYE